ncbi:MAG: S8 family serine peptidase [Candidatus Manganitrophaceae bacterium]
MNPAENTHRLALVNLTSLMERTAGRPEITIGFIDGPVQFDHPDLTRESIREIPRRSKGRCARADSVACLHGTFGAGILSARRGSVAPAISPGCTLLIRPVFREASEAPGASPAELAAAILDCVDAKARIINLSLAVADSLSDARWPLEEVLDYAARKGVIVVAAAGNQGALGGSAITRHPWVIPVVASDLRGRPISQSNLGASLGRSGLSAPGEGVRSLLAGGGTMISAGTSVAAPFVTGTVALLWSLFPHATAEAIRRAVTRSSLSRRGAVVPPLLNAEESYRIMTGGRSHGLKNETATRGPENRSATQRAS